MRVAGRQGKCLDLAAGSAFSEPTRFKERATPGAFLGTEELAAPLAPDSHTGALPPGGGRGQGGTLDPQHQPQPCPGRLEQPPVLHVGSPVCLGPGPAKLAVGTAQGKTALTLAPVTAKLRATCGFHNLPALSHSVPAR